MEMRIVSSDGPSTDDKLADCEIVFHEGMLAGLKLVGFGIWRSRRGVLPTVTFPARAFLVNGGRRYYALLRPTHAATSAAQDLLRATILQAFAEHERQHPSDRGEDDSSFAPALEETVTLEGEHEAEASEAVEAVSLTARRNDEGMDVVSERVERVEPGGAAELEVSRASPPMDERAT